LREHLAEAASRAGGETPVAAIDVQRVELDHELREITMAAEASTRR
jgi:hypothetical protein